MPVSTGIIPDALVATLVALLHVTAKSHSPACLDCGHDTTLGGRQSIAAVFTVGLAVAAEDFRYLGFSGFHRFVVY